MSITDAPVVSLNDVRETEEPVLTGRERRESERAIRYWEKKLEKLGRSATVAADNVSYRDVELDPDRGTITLRRPLTLDLGAVAKGLAVDAAARELAPFQDFAIDAGGDLYLGGLNEQGAPWSVGIRHPRNERELIASLRISNQAVCTSGDYERRAPGGNAHHILDPRTGASAHAVASATVGHSPAKVNASSTIT